MAWKRQEWRPVVVTALMLSAGSCGYVTGPIWIGERCFDNVGYWKNGVCYDGGGALRAVPRGWQQVEVAELAARTGHAKDWGHLTAGGADLDGDGVDDIAGILVNPSMTAFRLFVFYGKDNFAGDRAVALTAPQPIAEVAKVSVEVTGASDERGEAPQIVLRQTLAGARRDQNFVWRNGGLTEMTP